MLPLLAMGLLTGGALWGGNRIAQGIADERNAQLAQAVLPLLGQAPTGGGGLPMGPPDATGAMGGVSGTPGSGLLADPGDPRNQLRFAQGILASGAPGATKLGVGLIDQALGRATQVSQAEATRAQSGAQFQQEQSRLSSQFQTQFGLSKDEADRHAAQW